MQDSTAKSIMLDAALRYAQLGWKVFPAHWIKNGKCSCGEIDCGSPGKHPLAVAAPKGFHDATIDQEKIRGWWSKHPEGNIAVATGYASGFFVLDVDLPAGEVSRARLENKYDKLPETVEQITGAGGRHLLFKVPTEVEIRNSTGRLGSKLDIRGEGGYIIVAPSRHMSGKTYAWSPGHGPEEIGMAEAPPWLIDLVKFDLEPPKRELLQPAAVSQNAQTTPYGQAALEGEIQTLVGVPVGQRNDTLNRCAFRIGQLVSSGDISLTDAEAALTTAGEQIGLTSTEIRATMNSGLSKGMAKPRGTQNSGSVLVAKEKTEAPRPLVREIAPGGEYPIEALGQVLGDAVRAIGNIVQVPLALAAGSALAAASLAVQAHADVVLPIGDGRARPLSIYLLTIAHSSDRKSTADDFALRAVKEYEAALTTIYQNDFMIYQNKKSAFDREKEKILKGTRKGAAPTSATIESISFEIAALGDEPHPPLLPSLTIQEPTIEGLAKLFQLGRPSLGLFSTEGAQMITGYGMRDDRKLATAGGLSMLWDGDTFKRTRITDGNYALPGRRLTLHLMVQPEVARRLLSDPELADQGWTSRILIGAPVSLAGTRLFREADPSCLESLNRFEGKIAEILRKNLPLKEGTRNELKPRGLTFSPAAKGTWVSFHDEIETGIGRGGKFEQIKASAGKLAEHAARISGILTLIENFAATEVSAEAMENGCKLARFYADEALRLFYVGLISPELAEAEKLRDWLSKHDEKFISLPGIYQYGPKSIRERAKAKQIAKILEEHGWLIPKPEGAEIQGQFHREVWEIVKP